jgi:hypothetical protein
MELTRNRIEEMIGIQERNLAGMRAQHESLGKDITATHGGIQVLKHQLAVLDAPEPETDDPSAVPGEGDSD